MSSSTGRPPRSGNNGPTTASLMMTTTNTVSHYQNQHKNGGNGGRRQIPWWIFLMVSLASFLAGSMSTNAICVHTSDATTKSHHFYSSPPPPHHDMGLLETNRSGRQPHHTHRNHNDDTVQTQTIPIHTPQECLDILKMNNPRQDWTSFEEFVKQEEEAKEQQGSMRIRRAYANKLLSLEERHEHPLQQQQKQQQKQQKKQKRLPKSMMRFVEGMVRIKKADFVNKFDAGIPYDLSERGGDELLMFYNRRDAMPSNRNAAQQAELGTEDIPLLDAEDATENCQYVRVLNQPRDTKKRCFAFVPGYEMMTVQNWMRYGNKSRSPLDDTSPFKLASRGKLSNGKEEFEPPQRRKVVPMARDLTVQYLTRLEQAHEQLKPLARAAKTAANSVVVMTCNHGQSELLMNFVCAAKSRGISTNPIILFATDVETYELSQSLGLKTYYDEETFKDLPTSAAAVYGDVTFSMMMMAKIYCVHMLTSLGYHVLFQDVDMIWYKNPLEFFEDKSLPTYEFDMHFQDDGSRQVRFAPYSANSGFYYIRNNPVTQLFMENFVMAGVSVLAGKSHQQTMISLINEHMTLYGLKVKVYSRVDTDYFPGGYHYHMNKQWMREFLKGNNKNPYIFHMCWTENKQNKVLFLRQMGEWYVQDTCIGSTVKDILGSKTTSHIDSTCCSAEPLISCHYRDKPSKHSCADSPPIDKGGKSFW